MSAYHIHLCLTLSEFVYLMLVHSRSFFLTEDLTEMVWLVFCRSAFWLVFCSILTFDLCFAYWHSDLCSAAFWLVFHRLEPPLGKSATRSRLQWRLGWRRAPQRKDFELYLLHRGWIVFVAQQFNCICCTAIEYWKSLNALIIWGICWLHNQPSELFKWIKCK